MKPMIHSKNSVHKFGGKEEDYQKIHDWFDQTKAHVAEMKHRIFLHNSFGIFLCEQQFGTYIVNSDGNKIGVRDIGEQHVLEDLGFIPSLDKCCEAIQNMDWLFGSKRGMIKVLSKKED